MFTIRQQLEKEWELIEEMRQLFIDFKKAYHSDIGPRKYWILDFLVLPRILVSLIKICLSDSRGRIRVNEILSEDFSVRDGLKEGDDLLCIFVNLILEYVVRQVETTSTDAIFSGITQIFGYADDLHLLRVDKEMVAKYAEILIAKVCRSSS